jgi:hypothetical protein
MAETEFQRQWAAEVIRQREVHWGPLADSRALRIARRKSTQAEQITARAAVLVKEQGFAAPMQHYATWLRMGQMLLACLAVIAGITLANSIVSSNDRVISLLEALFALLALNTLLILVWAISASFRARPGGVGAFLLRQMNHLIKKDRLAAIAQAHASLSLRQGLLKPASGIASHGFWALLLSTALVTLIIRFAVQDYQFVWRTTLLDESSVRAIIDMLSTLPALLGQPSPAVFVNVSPDSHNLHQQTAHWLLTCIALYALAPRLVLLAACALWLKVRRSQLRWDLSLPGFFELLPRLRAPDYAVVDPAPADDKAKTTAPSRPLASVSSANPLLFTLEHHLDSLELPATLSNAGMVASREQRHQLLAQLEQHPGRRVLAIIDSSLTPDRGSLRLLNDVAELATLGVCIHTPPRREDRGKLWHEALGTQLGQHLWNELEPALTWLEKGDENA